ncbi:MAG TPA: hypothetical protein VG498_04275 [Terriglobales bacterium]|nr:hypothetical protein [Terriglobales bacterium]
MKKLSIFTSLVMLCASASATTIIPMSVERLTDISSDVVVAHATRSWSEWNNQHTMLVTYTQFTVDSRLKGAASATITVKQPGGSAEGYTQRVAGVRPWSAGESAVLFLKPSTSHDGTLVISGLMQGDFRVRRSSSGSVIADNGVEGTTRQVSNNLESFNVSNGSVSPYTGNRMSLDELQRRVRTRTQTR